MPEKLFETKNLDAIRAKIVETTKVMQARIDVNRDVNIMYGGPVNTGTPSKEVHHVQAKNESMCRASSGNTVILVGEDRPGGRGTGWGSKGAAPFSKATNRIELTAGKMARAFDGEGPPDGTYADPSPYGDAAKVYIADVTNPDTNFGFCDSEIGNIKGQSAIVNFADQIRIFGLGGVQISTGQPQLKTGPGGIKTSLGKAIDRAPPIILSAGNVDGLQKNALKKIKDLGPFDKVPVIQGVAKGDNVVLAFRSLSGILDRIIGCLIRMGAYLGTLWGISGVQIPPFVNPHLPGVTSIMAKETFTGFLQSLIALRLDISPWEAKYCNHRSAMCVKSKNVFSS